MKYYYLISSLPVLQLDATSISQEELDGIIELINQNLTTEDHAISQYLLYEGDNQNLLHILFREYHEFETHSFNHHSSIPIEILENYRREYKSLPDYMINYLNNHSDSFSSLSLREMENLLNQYFYEALVKLDSLFISTFYLWKFMLNQTIAMLNLKNYPFLKTRSEVAEPDFLQVTTLHSIRSFEDIANQLMPLIEENNLEAIERKVNSYYWEFADCWQEPFASEQVFAYMLKLIRLYRWRGLSSERDSTKSNFEKLIKELKETSSSPKMPVI